MSTEEIARTVSRLTADTLREAIKQAGSKPVGNKQQLIKQYETSVMDVGTEKFFDRLSNDQLEQTAKLLQVEQKTDGLKEALVKQTQTGSITDLLSKADMPLLKQFSTTMGLEVSTDKKEMEKQIADEVMLTGMEGFLNKLDAPVLKKHCKELSLPQSGGKKELVERLMVHTFELEPLDKEGQEPEKEAPKKEEKAKEEAKPKETKKRKREEKEPKKEPKKEEKKAAPKEKRAPKGANKKQKEEPKKEEEKPKQENGKPVEAAPAPAGTPRGKYVAPALSTIVKGEYTAADLHNKFNLTDLQEYCKGQGLLVSGPKKKIIKRIVNYLETGEKEEKPTKKVKKAKKDKKKGGGKKKKEAPAATTTTTAEESAPPSTTTTTEPQQQETKA